MNDCRSSRAVAVGRPAVDLQSDRREQSGVIVIQQLLDLRRLLELHRGARVVTEFLSCLDEALREREWLYQWLTQDGRGYGTALGERW